MYLNYPDLPSIMHFEVSHFAFMTRPPVWHRVHSKPNNILTIRGHLCNLRFPNSEPIFYRWKTAVTDRKRQSMRVPWHASGARW